MVPFLPVRRPGRLALTLALLAGAGLAGAGYYFLSGGQPGPPPPGDEDTAPATPAAIRSFCSACHAYPPPDSFPRAAWKHEVDLA